MLPNTAKRIRPAAITIPIAMLQNKKTISIGSFMAVLKRTIDNAPTIPKDDTTLLVMDNITKVVIKDNPMREIPKLEEYITPEKVFLYTKKIKIPKQKAKRNDSIISKAVIDAMLFKKLDLNIS